MLHQNQTILADQVQRQNFHRHTSLFCSDVDAENFARKFICMEIEFIVGNKRY